MEHSERGHAARDSYLTLWDEAVVGLTVRQEMVEDGEEQMGGMHAVGSDMATQSDTREVSRHVQALDLAGL